MTDCIPLIFNCLASQLNGGDEDRVRDATEYLVRLLSCDATFFKSHLANVVSFTSSLAANADLEDSTRKMAMEFLLSLAQNGGGMVRKLNTFPGQTIPLAFNFLHLVDEDSDWDSASDDSQLEQDMFKMGLEATDRLAAALGGKVFLPVALPLLEAGLNSPDWVKRHASLYFLSELLDGCKKQLTPNLANLNAMLAPRFQDDNKRVRYAAFNCLAQFCSDFAPQYQQTFHEFVIPTILRGTQDPNPRVVALACLLVVDFCSGIEGESEVEFFHTHTDAIMAQLVQLLMEQRTVKIMENALTAVGAVAHIISSKFNKYYGTLMPCLKTILQSAVNVEHRLLRGKAMEAVALIATAVGDQIFNADALEILQILLNTQSRGLSNDDPQYSYMVQALARICDCVGEAFIPFLEHVIPPLLESAAAEGGRMVADVGAPDEDTPEGVEVVVVNVRGSGNVRLEYNTAVLQEKAMACNTLYSYAKRLGAGFFPYVPQVFSILVPLFRYRYNEDVRIASVSAMPVLLESARRHLLQNNQGLEYVRQLFEEAFPSMLKCMMLEPDIDQLCNIVRCFTECLECIPGSLSAEQNESVVQVVYNLLEASKERRQQRLSKLQSEDADDEEAEQVDELNDAETELLGFLIDFNNRMVKASGEVYTASFHTHLLPIITTFLTDASSSVSERVTALCVMDDIIEHGGSLALQYAPAFLPFALNNITNADVDIRQAAIYGAGVLSQVTPHIILPHLTEMMSSLVSVATAPDARSEDNYPSTCNAVSALRKVLEHANEGLNLAEWWARWVTWLPLDGDEDEAKLNHTRLLELVQAQDVNVMGQDLSNMPRIVSVLCEVWGSITVSDSELDKRITDFLRSVQQQMPQLLSATSPDHQQKIAQILASQP
eukprot:TRINITY_DN6380_c0_g1_i1.p1 TRINITY_DN6380_c0_g1~~TRINITY_DN6380_c0_g1_i1.p1  ORF type:complete len:955 (-),score=344.36 TRINITY_DN6380_c0_g1_i1:235-2901(-)